jgi:hypothetical protein
MNDIFEPIVLTEAQEKYAGPAKSELYKNNYLECIKRMKVSGRKFPFDARSELGIDVTKFAKWCGFRRRQTVYDNHFIRERIARDVEAIGVDSYKPKTISEEKKNQLFTRQSKAINEHQSRFSELSSRIDVLTERTIEQDNLIASLKAQLIESKSDNEFKIKAHQEQVQNSIMFGGRSFDY